MKETLYTEKQVQKMIDDALTNYEIGWADRKKQFSLYEHKDTITSADTVIQCYAHNLYSRLKILFYS